MATLTISHYVYLTREERYKVHSLKEGESIEVVGISVPVWFDKGTTSEPARELFCKYTIINEKPNRAIASTNEGFLINLPQEMEFEKDIPNEVKKAVVQQVGTSENLLDVKDGGKEWLEFKQFNKVKYNKRSFNIVHFVEIKSKEILMDTLS